MQAMGGRCRIDRWKTWAAWAARKGASGRTNGWRVDLGSGESGLRLKTSAVGGERASNKVKGDKQGMCDGKPGAMMKSRNREGAAG